MQRKSREEKLPPRRFLNSKFYRKVKPWKHTAPMQKDIHPQFWDQDNRGYQPVSVTKAPKEWKHLVESRMSEYSEKDKYLFCWVIPGKDRQLPQRDDVIEVAKTGDKFTVAESQGSSMPGYPRSRNTGFVILSQQQLSSSSSEQPSPSAAV
jgi:hypothetical protein